MAKKKKEEVQETIEKTLWKAADKLRKNINAAEYKDVVLGLIFLKYISIAFEKLHADLTAQIDQGADPEDREEYTAENVFFVPPSGVGSSAAIAAPATKEATAAATTVFTTLP
jgi:type I restriction enzyme M protein